jgi:hypothetical protein
MQLRHHPAMRYRGVSNWPPTWTQPDGTSLSPGEIGILQYVHTNPLLSGKCFLVIEHEGQRWVGSLIFDNAALCRQISEIIKPHLGRTIEEIGDLDVSHTL